MTTLRHPSIIAHRANTDGDNFQEENTIGAIRRAFTLDGLDGIELDVDLTQDGVLVLNHRDTLTAPPTISLDYHGLLQHYQRRPVPRLAEALQELRALLDAQSRENTLVINIEVKRDPEAAVLYPENYAGMILENLLGHLDGNEFVVSSFDMELLLRLRKNHAGVAIGLILPGDSGTDVLLAAIREVEPDFLAAHAALLGGGSETRGILTECKNVYVWTVDDDPGLTAFLKDKAVAGVITNQPGRGIALRNSLK